MSSIQKYCFLLFAFILSAQYALSDDTTRVDYQRFVPDVAKIQFAGSIGFISLGAGYSFWSENIESSLFYSYIPKSIAGVNINTVTWKNSLKVCKFMLTPSVEISPYISGSFSFSGFLPVRVLPQLGISVKSRCKRRFKGIDLYFESVSDAIYIENYISNKSVKITSIISFAIGTSIYF